MAFVKGQGVIDGGTLKIYSGTNKAFTAEDLIGELTDINGMGASRETKELDGYHYDSKLKKLGNSTLNDVSFTENLTKDALAKRREQYENKESFYTGVFDEDGELLYGCFGAISQWGMTLPNGDTTQLTYTMALEQDNVTDLTLPAAG